MNELDLIRRTADALERVQGILEDEVYESESIEFQIDSLISRVRQLGKRVRKDLARCEARAAQK